VVAARADLDERLAAVSAPVLHLVPAAEDDDDLDDLDGRHGAPPARPTSAKATGKAKERTTTGWVLAYVTERVAVGALSARSGQHYRMMLLGFAGCCPDDVAKITRRHAVKYATTFKHLAPATRHHYMKVARGFSSWLLRRGLVRRDPWDDIPSPRVPTPLHRALDVEQLEALVSACDDTRELLIVILGLQTGLRRAELAALEVGDVALAARTVIVREGKGGKARQVPLPDEAVRVVARYLAEEGVRNGPLLRSKSVAHAGIKAGTVGLIFSAVAVRAGVKVRAWDGVGPHSLRHTFASDVYGRSRDAKAVQQLLGHGNLATTQIYIAGVGMDVMRAAAEGRTYLGPGPSAPTSPPDTLDATGE